MKILSYYTNDTYKALAEKLRRSLGRFQFPCEIEAVDDWGRPMVNRQYKATYLLKKLDEFSGEDLIWMDADCEALMDPVLFRKPFPKDVGLFKCGFEFWSTVLCLRNGEGARKFLHALIEEHKANPDKSDLNIKEALKKSQVAYWELPPTYVWYERTFRLVYRGMKPIVNHLCVSQS